MAIATLSIDLEARLAKFQAGLDRAEQLAARSAKNMEGAFDAVKGGLAGLAAAVSVGAIVQMVRATVNGVDALNDLADATGDSVENLSALEDIALRTGTSMDTASDAVVKLNKALFEAKNDPESAPAQALKNLGLDVKRLLALSPVERLQEVGRALNSFSGENKLEYNLALLGKTTREIAPLLKDMAEAGKLNATVMAKQAEEAEKFNKELFALEKTVTDTARSIVGPLVSSINATIEAFRKGRAEGKGFWATVFSQPIRGATPSLDELRQSEKDTSPVALPKLPGLPSAGSAAAAKKAADERLRLAEFTARQIVDIEEQAAADTAAAWKVWEGQQLDLAKERADAEKEQWRQVFEFIDQQQAAEIEAGQAVLEVQKKTLDDWSVFADQAARNIQDSIGNTLLSVMEGNFRSIGDSWKAMLDRMVAEALAAKLAKSLLGDFGSTGEVGGWAGDFFKWAGTFFGGGRAAGGPVRAGMTYLVGERGPELLHMGRGSGGGTITPNGGGGMAGTYAPVFHFNGPVDRRSASQVEAAAYAGAARAYARNS